MEKRNSTSDSSRPPIVAVLGHVDHGKTTLLDAIRKTSVQKKEAGGITQKIGASVVKLPDGHEITFIDTPGHAAFANMRSRGANVADIAILVVAAEEGVKPQTKEALEFILAAKVPYIVAATKIDLQSASVETVYTQLAQLGVLFEGRGGDVPLIPVSAKTGQGVNDLLEMISLVSELHGIKGDKAATLEAVVIETGVDKRGPLASIIVRNGTLKVGDEIVTQKEETRVRGLFNEEGKSVKEVGPGKPTQVIGFTAIPTVGFPVWRKGDKSTELVSSMEKPVVYVHQKGEVGSVVKAQNTGALEAVIANLPAEVFVLDSSVGDVTQSDVFMAKSADAYIFAFESKIPADVRRLAENEGVEIFSFKIIYELFEKLEEFIEKRRIKITGKAAILAEFPFNGKRVAGCKVLQGSLSKSDNVILTRNEKELGSVKLLSIKKQKADLNEVRQGEECGILFVPSYDFKTGDVLMAVKK